MRQNESNPAGDYNGEVESIPYRYASDILRAEMDLLTETALDLLEDKYREKGDGWQYEEPRWHMWKGMDEYFSATHCMHKGDIDLMYKHLSHGFNHMAMASFLAAFNIHELNPDTQNQ